MNSIDYINDESTRRLANLLHFIIYDAKITQIFHRLRLGVKENDIGSFSEIIAIALKDYYRLKEDANLKEAASFSLPNEEDIKKAQNFFLQYGRNYIKVLLARASGYKRSE
ncbi:MAG: hypothetical protein H5T50_08220 [Nitrososphaeria archaeon]|nr:hypothetical protein [Nitrososphaeria archaeon]